MRVCDYFTLFLFRSDYVKLYVETVKTTLQRIDGEERPFITSSPSNGIFSGPAVNYISADPLSELAGDIHHYNYDSNCLSTSIHPIPRFISEFG
jgi:hypothetical protein